MAARDLNQWVAGSDLAQHPHLVRGQLIERVPRPAPFFVPETGRDVALIGRQEVDDCCAELIEGRVFGQGALRSVGALNPTVETGRATVAGDDQHLRWEPASPEFTLNLLPIHPIPQVLI